VVKTAEHGSLGDIRRVGGVKMEDLSHELIRNCNVIVML
jgi:hypothetical protein